jgi:hypothetical protein
MRKKSKFNDWNIFKFYYLDSNNTSDEINPNCEDDVKLYRLATEKKIDSLMAQYKRFKTQHSPIPPTITETQVTKKKSLERKASNDRQLMSAEKDNEKLIIKVLIKLKFYQIF